MGRRHWNDSNIYGRDEINVDRRRPGYRDVMTACGASRLSRPLPNTSPWNSRAEALTAGEPRKRLPFFACGCRPGYFLGSGLQSAGSQIPTTQSDRLRCIAPDYVENVRPQFLSLRQSPPLKYSLLPGSGVSGHGFRGTFADRIGPLISPNTCSRFSPSLNSPKLRTAPIRYGDPNGRKTAPLAPFESASFGVSLARRKQSQLRCTLMLPPSLKCETDG